MARMATGRIVTWDGASLWVLRTSESSAEIAPHAHHAIQVTINLGGTFELRTATEAATGPVAAVAADASHVFNASSGAAAFLFIAPESDAGRILTARWFEGQSLRTLDPRLFEQFMQGVRGAMESPGADSALIALGKTIVAELSGSVQAIPADKRVVAMIDFVATNLDDRCALDRAARHVNLSKSRASHLFVEQTGLPLKSYVLWRRLGRAVDNFSKGATLTEAAHEAGFSDSAHFSRTFRRMFGLPAASLQLAKTAMQPSLSR